MTLPHLDYAILERKAQTVAYEDFLSWFHSLPENVEDMVGPYSEKMRKRADELGMTLEALVSECKVAPSLAKRLFAVDVKRKTFHQNAAIEHLKTHLPSVGCHDFVGLNSSGASAKYLSNGVVLQNVHKSGKKSIDFEWSYTHPDLGFILRFYASHKYIKDKGGAQDNQFNDLVSFVKNTSGYPSRDSSEIQVFLAIADGDYFSNKVQVPDGKGSFKLKTKAEILGSMGVCVVTDINHVVPETQKAIAETTHAFESRRLKAGIQIQPKNKLIGPST